MSVIDPSTRFLVLVALETKPAATNARVVVKRIFFLGFL